MTVELFCDHCGYYAGSLYNMGGLYAGQDTIVLCEDCQPVVPDPQQLVGNEHAPRMSVEMKDEETG